MSDMLEATDAPAGQRAFVLPAAYAQQRLWFLDRLEPNSSVYNVPLVTRLRGRLDLQALNQAFTAIAERHETLRTTFTVVDLVPHQLVSPPQPVTIGLLDVSTSAQPA